MRLSPKIFWEAIELYEECKKSGKVFSRELIKKKFGVSDVTARSLKFAIENRDLLSQKYPTIGETTKKALVIADTHIPFQDPVAVELALSEGEKEKVDTVILLGDIVDFYQISVFGKMPRPDIQDELEEARKFLKELRHRFKNSEILYVEGNHEKRLISYVLENARELYPLLEGVFEMKYGLSDLNIKYIKAPFKIVKLNFIHGHEINDRVRDLVNIANFLWKNTVANVIAGHFHRDDIKTFRTIDDTSYVVCAIGYLASSLEYKKIHNWTQGFAVVEFFDNGNFTIKPRRIIDGAIY